MMIKKIVLISFLGLVYVGCKNPSFINKNTEVAQTTENTEVTQTTENTEVAQTTENTEVAQTTENTEVGQTTENTEVAQLNTKKYCTAINYRNQSYLDRLNLKAHNNENISLYNNQNKTISLMNKALATEVKNSCLQISLNQNRAFGFENQDGYCICAYGSQRR